VHENRREKALNCDKSLLGEFKEWLVHDCWSGNFKFDGINHAICEDQILRKLEGSRETVKSKCASSFKPFLRSVYLMFFEQRVKRRQHIEARYSIFVKSLKTQNLYL